MKVVSTKPVRAALVRESASGKVMRTIARRTLRRRHVHRPAMPVCANYALRVPSGRRHWPTGSRSLRDQLLARNGAHDPAEARRPSASHRPALDARLSSTRARVRTTARDARPRTRQAHRRRCTASPGCISLPSAHRRLAVRRTDPITQPARGSTPASPRAAPSTVTRRGNRGNARTAPCLSRWPTDRCHIDLDLHVHDGEVEGLAAATARPERPFERLDRAARRARRADRVLKGEQ